MTLCSLISAGSSQVIPHWTTWLCCDSGSLQPALRHANIIVILVLDEHLYRHDVPGIHTWLILAVESAQTAALKTNTETLEVCSHFRSTDQNVMLVITLNLSGKTLPPCGERIHCIFAEVFTESNCGCGCVYSCECSERNPEYLWEEAGHFWSKRAGCCRRSLTHQCGDSSLF